MRNIRRFSVLLVASIIVGRGGEPLPIKAAVASQTFDVMALRPVTGPGVDPRPLPAWGIYARHVERLTVEDARLGVIQPDYRPAILADDVGVLTLDNVRFPRLPEVKQPIVTTHVANVVEIPAPPLR